MSTWPVNPNDPLADPSSAEPETGAPAAPVTEEVADEPAPAPTGGESAADEVTRQRDEYLDALQRTKAEFDNYRKRAERDRQAAAAGAAREVVRSLLPIIDNLERAVAALGDQGEAIVAGVDMVRNQLVTTLAGHGVAEIPAAIDTAFDPNLHEAIAQIPAPDHPAGSIVEVVEKGYVHAEIVLRPTKVVVAAEAAS